MAFLYVFICMYVMFCLTKGIALDFNGACMQVVGPCKFAQAVVLYKLAWWDASYSVIIVERGVQISSENNSRLISRSFL